MQVCYFWLVGWGFFAILCPCRIIWPNTGGYDEKGPINLKSIVWAGADAELGPCSSLCKLTELLALGAHFLKLTPWVHMWSVIVYSSLVAETTPQHLSLQELFGQNLCAKNYRPFQCKPLSPLCSLRISAYPFPLLYEAEHCWQGGVVGSASGTCQLLLHPAPPKHSTIPPETLGTAAQTWGVCWRSHSKFVDK